MTKSKLQEYDATAGNNTDVAGINIAENCAAANINNAIRALMGHIKTALSGSDDSIITGTAGTTDYTAKWNADGDLVDGYQVHDEDDMASDDAAGLATQQSIKAYVDAAMPPGAVIDYAGSTAPSGWLFCAGQAVSRTTYAALFTAIGTTYGVGDGSTTFNLPDLRGRVTVGKDDMTGSAASRMTSGGSGVDGATLGASGGAETHTLTTSEIPAHTHTHDFRSTLSNIQEGTGSLFDNVHRGNTSVSTGSTGGGGSHNNTQPSIIINKIIKA